MGRGNVCVTGQYEGLYYIDSEHYDVYERDDPYVEYPERCLKCDLSYNELTGGDWFYDDIGSSEEYDDIIQCFVKSFTRMFRSFWRPDRDIWLGRNSGEHVLLESKLFYIVEQDNEWSMAIKLIQKLDPFDDRYTGLQKRHYQRYLDGIKRCLLERLPSIGSYKGAWTSGTIHREEVFG